MKAMLEQMKGCKDDVRETSKYAESLKHIALYDKGGKVYVTDRVTSSLLKFHHLNPNFSSKPSILQA